MPEPIGKYSTDRPFYSLSNSLSKCMCCVSPNFITVLSAFMILPIMYNYYYVRGISELIFLAILREFLDFLDGSIARNCGKSSEYGGYLDYISDYFCGLILIIFTFYHFMMKKNKKVYDIIILIILCFQFLVAVYALISNDLSIKKDNNELVVLLHDNCMLVTLAMAVLIKYFWN